MPELPEVETIARKLQGVLPGKVVERVTKLHQKTFQGDESLFLGQTITQVTRRAKIIQIKFANELSLLIHLKMTGQFIYLDEKVRLGGGHPTADWVLDLPSKHTRVFFTFTDGSRLFFNDQRLFGWIKVVTPAEVAKIHAELAPDVIEAAVTPEYLFNKLQRRGQAVKLLIMDTTIMCGLGNIYACDALNLAKIHPERPGKSLNLAEVTTLLEAAKQVLNKGIELGGTTFDGKYVDIDGMAGSYQSVVRVYGREGKECLNFQGEIHCQGEIKKSRLGGRGTYYCSVCQV